MKKVSLVELREILRPSSSFSGASISRPSEMEDPHVVFRNLPDTVYSPEPSFGEMPSAAQLDSSVRFED